MHIKGNNIKITLGALTPWNQKENGPIKKQTVYMWHQISGNKLPQHVESPQFDLQHHCKRGNRTKQTFLRRPRNDQQIWEKVFRITYYYYANQSNLTETLFHSSYSAFSQKRENKKKITSVGL